MPEAQIKEQIREVMHDMYPDIDLDTEEDLIGSGLLDSLSIIELTATLEDECDVQFTPLDMIPANFASLDSISALVSSKLDD